MKTSDMVAPGQSHPAVVEYLPLLRSYKDRDTVLVAIQRRASWKFDDAADPTTSSDFAVHTFQRNKAYQSFFPDLGAWVWDVWTDELGRSVADNAEWVAHPQALLRAQFNPVRPSTEMRISGEDHQ